MIAQTTAGAVRGRSTGAVVHFAGIPYATAARFARPSPPAAWTGTRDALAPGPIAPQPPSRLERVMGPLRHTAQSEDCLTADVWTPGADDARRPVLVWLHGGGFSSGSGSADWYDGTLLAARGDLVVVTVNYRLGALGYAYVPDAPAPANRGLLDMRAALEWVRDNAAAFGGDPGRVTVAGQSGGALSIVPLLDSGLFRRAILQSGPFAIRPWSSSAAAEFAARLGDGLHDMPVDRLLAAQQEVARATAAAGPNPFEVTPPFMLVADGDLVTGDPIGTALARRPEVELLAGWTRDELAAFVAGDPRFEAVGKEQVIRAARDWYGDDAERRYQEVGAATPAKTVLALATGAAFSRDTLRLAGGLPTTLYRFDWRPAGSPFGACHCLDLPFVFGNAEAWREAPMVPGGVLPAGLVEQVQSTWIAFTRGDRRPAGPIVFDAR